MGRFVVFEGPEGSGKTTQIGLLHKAFAASGHDVLCTREPGGTPIAEQIRNILHDTANEAMLPTTEALLYSAARAQHVGKTVRPALKAGRLVISDRYALSTLAYQGYGHGLDLGMLRGVTDFATGSLWPDLVIYLDLDVRVGLARKRRDQAEGRGEWNRMDQQSVAFHERVRQGYLAMAADDPDRWLVVDAALDPETISARILARIQALDSGESVGAAPQGG